MFLFSPTSGGIKAFDAESGQEKWRFNQRGSSATPPAVADGVVYFGTDGTIQGGKHQTSAHLSPGQSVRMHIFIDRSVLEFFVAGRTVTERLYPDHRGRRLDLFAEGGKVTLRSLDIWNMDTCWKEPG